MNERAERLYSLTADLTRARVMASILRDMDMIGVERPEVEKVAAVVRNWERRIVDIIALTEGQ